MIRYTSSALAEQSAEGGGSGAGVSRRLFLAKVPLATTVGVGYFGSH